MTGNKGEWSEVYTLLKILSDKHLFAGDSNLHRIEKLIYPIVKVLRDESSGTYEYGYKRDLVIIKGNGEEFRIPIDKFRENSVLLLSKIRESTSTTFSIPEIEEFVRSFKCNSLTANATVKSDIRVMIHDHRTGITPQLGFSIKSQLGGASTLLNAGKTTNFIYKIKNAILPDSVIGEINDLDSRSKIKDRLQKIFDYSGTLEFSHTENKIFGNNLMLIDSALTRILAELLILFFTTDKTKLVDLVNEISDINPLGFNLENNHPFYSYKTKRFLTDVALGMMPSSVWTGELDATGGYLVVKEDGDILCYHIYNRNEFENYLLNNTKLETASSTRHGFGVIYTNDGQQYINLNLQIRFLK